jgi:site-specific DNA recombinase
LVIQETLAQARCQIEDGIERLRVERAEFYARLRDDHAELGQLATTSRPGDPRLADAHDHIREAERRVTEIDGELATLSGDLVDEADVATALADFDAVWTGLTMREQARVIELLIERIKFNGDGGTVSITFRPSGIKSLAGELAEQTEDAA